MAVTSARVPSKSEARCGYAGIDATAAIRRLSATDELRRAASGRGTSVAAPPP
jgi:hypothetical protein